MVHRDPQTGKFVADDGAEDLEIEYLTFSASLTLPAATATGATDEYYGDDSTFEGELLYDVDEIVDRHEVASLVHASHVANVQPTGTQTADSAAIGQFEISASPDRAVVEEITPSELDDIADSSSLVAESKIVQSDTADLVGRPLSAMAQGPFTDGTAGLGGGGGPGIDRTEVEPLSFDMDRRDEMYLNGAMQAQNLSDGPLTASVVGQHVYVIEEP